MGRVHRASGIEITPAWRGVRRTATVDPGFQFQAIIGGDVDYYGDVYPDSLNGALLLQRLLRRRDLRRRPQRPQRRSVPLPARRQGPIQFIEGPDGYVYYLALESREVGRLEIVERDAPQVNRIELAAAKATYAGTANPDIYVVNAASDSTGAARDRIMGFDVADGDRIDFVAMGWDSADIAFTRHNVGSASEFTRVNGPGGFSLRVDGPQAALAGGFVFAEGPANRAPVAANDAATSVAGAQVTIDVLGNDGDPDGDGLTVSAFDAVSANGGAIVRSGAGLAYTPAAGFFGTDTFDYLASDGAATDEATVTVTVTRPATGGRIVNLTAAKVVYTGKAGADIYVVDDATDSTAAARDRISNFNPAAGDRIDFGPAGWDSADISLRGFDVGRPGEFTRIEGPGGFSLRVDGPGANLTRRHAVRRRRADLTGGPRPRSCLGRVDRIDLPARRPGAESMIGRLNHVAIAVPDLDAAVAQYRDTLGAQVRAPQDEPDHGVTVVFIDLPNTKIELLHPLGDASPIAAFLARNPSGGIHHICYEVDDILAARDRLRAQGARVLGDGEPKIGAHGKPVLFLHPKDFTGALVELEQA